MVTTESVIQFPSAWISSNSFERALFRATAAPHSNKAHIVRILVPTGCNLMVDSGAKLLSLTNQLCHAMKAVTIEFEDGESGTMGYLNRMGLFDMLDATVKVLPARPAMSGAQLYRGGNRNLVEFKALRRGGADKELPASLADSLHNAAPKTTANRTLGDTAYTIFSEIIGNVYRHSSTPLDGCAALQYYPNGKKVTVCVSDSGYGIMDTLRPTLRKHFPALVDKSDTHLLIEMVSKGLSRFGRDNGCGIRQCAVKALSLNASLEIRMPTSRVVFKRKSERLNLALYEAELPLLWGTHICLDFQLD